ncbi:toxin-antitoxin system HicB family antitoxin [Sunxiuqinia sp. A32]|uniref:toxin-antitoxin system HicB family antitoxin n=1 Tax=Sunxiuqinia sp. A32 TaxID=3461496 RepID=UPI004045B53C
MKNLEYYKGLDYKMIIEKQSFEGETFFVCFSEELGRYSCFGQGDSVEEAIKNYQVEKDFFIETLCEEGLKVPEPSKEQSELLSGVFNVRTDPATHTNLALQAKRNNLSLNQYVNKLLHEGSALSSVTDILVPKLQEMTNMIVAHDCSVKEQFKEFWLNIGLKNIKSKISSGWNEEMGNELEFSDIAA